MYFVRPRLLLVPCAAAILAIGCGQSSLSPTGPSGVPGSTALSTGDSVLASTSDTFSALGRGGGGGGNNGGGGNGNGNGNGKGGDESLQPENGSPGRSHQARVSGFVTSVGAGTLTADGVTIEVSAETVIRHGNDSLLLSDIEVGDHVQARGTMDGTTLEAIEIKVEDTDGPGEDDDDDADARVQGTISGLTGTCAGGLTFTIGTTSVTTNALTEFKNAGCSFLVNGATVAVKGTAQPNGSIVASRIEVTLTEIEGAVSGLGGTCAAGLTFTIGTTAVTTNAATLFTGGECSTIANLTNVEVRGVTQTGGSIAAVRVRID
jgi:hypothetical protein